MHVSPHTHRFVFLMHRMVGVESPHSPYALPRRFPTAEGSRTPSLALLTLNSLVLRESSGSHL